MTVALSLLTAVAWTAANYWLVPLSRRIDSYLASLLMLVGNGLCTIPLALALDGVPQRGDLRPLGFAVLAGVLEVGGFVFFFRALERGDLAVVAPIIGIEGGIAAASVFAFGERVSLLVGLGLAVSLAGGCLAAAQGRRGTAAGALPAFGAALCFGLMFALYAAAEDLGPVSVVAGGRLSALTLLCLLVLWRRPPFPSRAVTSRVLAIGGLDAAAFVSYAYAAARGPVSVAAVVAGQFSTLSAVVGIVLLRERLSPHQYAGIALAGAGTTLLALAQ
jgi:drug/metabolite transporter (DMT)-like permease